MNFMTSTTSQSGKLIEATFTTTQRWATRGLQLFYRKGSTIRRVLVLTCSRRGICTKTGTLWLVLIGSTVSLNLPRAFLWKTYHRIECLQRVCNSSCCTTIRMTARNQRLRNVFSYCTCWQTNQEPHANVSSWVYKTRTRSLCPQTRAPLKDSASLLWSIVQDLVQEGRRFNRGRLGRYRRDSRSCRRCWTRGWRFSGSRTDSGVEFISG